MRLNGREQSRIARFAAVFLYLVLVPSIATAVCTETPGDVNDDGTASISDVQCGILVALWSFAGGAEVPPTCVGSDVERADLTCDESYTVSDIQLTIALALGLGLPADVDATGSGCADACEQPPCTDPACLACEALGPCDPNHICVVDVIGARCRCGPDHWGPDCDIPLDDPCGDGWGRCSSTEGLVDVTASRDAICGLDAAGSVHCVNRTSAAFPPPPDDSFFAIKSGRDHFCGLTLDGELRCWGLYVSEAFFGSEGGPVDFPGHSIADFDVGDFSTCLVLDIDGAGSVLSCAGGDLDGYSDSGVSVAVGTETVAYCYVESDGRGACKSGSSSVDTLSTPAHLTAVGVTNSAEAFPVFTLDDGRGFLPIAGSAPAFVPLSGDEAAVRSGVLVATELGGLQAYGYTGVSGGPIALTDLDAADGEGLCGLDPNGRARCIGPSVNSRIEYPPPYLFSAIDGDSGAMCGLEVGSSRPRCWGSIFSGTLAEPFRRDFVDLAASSNSNGSHFCGLTLDGEVACWAARPRFFRRPTGAYKELVHAKNTNCARRDNGEVECFTSYAPTWVDADYDVVAAMPAGLLDVDFDVVFDFTVAPTPFYAMGCGVKSDGQIECWSKSGSVPAVPSGSFDRVVVRGDQVCGRAPAGPWTCTGATASALEAELDSAVQIQTDCTLDADGTRRCLAGVQPNVAALGGGRDCWLTDGGGVSCNSDNPYIDDAPSGSFSAIAGTTTDACAIAADGTLDCWGQNYGPAVALDEVHAGTESVCGLRPDSTVVCWGILAIGLPSSTPPPSGEFTQLEMSGYNACGVRPSGQIECWGDKQTSQGIPAPPSGVFVDVAVGPGAACGVTSDGTITCSGVDSPTDLPPLSVGSTRHVTLDSGSACYQDLGGESPGPQQCWYVFGVLGDFDLQGSPTDAPFNIQATGFITRCGLVSDSGEPPGRAECWGLGLPIDVPNDTDFIDLGLAEHSACALKPNGQLRCFGGSRRLLDL